MWTPTTRRQHSREGLRYETDLTDGEWRVIEPHRPPPCRYGRPRARSLRAIVDAIFYVLRGGIAWRRLPSDFPPWRTVSRWFSAWRDKAVFERINHALVMADRARVGREASPSAAIIDSQSVKPTEAGGPRGYDAGKKIHGRKRHALVETDGRGLVIEPHPASIQDRDGGGPLLRVSRPRSRSSRKSSPTAAMPATVSRPSRVCRSQSAANGPSVRGGSPGCGPAPNGYLKAPLDGQFGHYKAGAWQTCSCDSLKW